jgi:predicted RNA-binding protein with PUA-like domain
MRHWLVKQEPDSYAWGTFKKEKGTSWTGVRNYQARNNLRAMRRGDLVFYYHSGESREIVGLARVTREAYPDPTATEGDWSCVDLKPVKALRRPVSLAWIKTDPLLKTMSLVRNSRLSVSGLSLEQFNRVLELVG